MKRSEIEKDVVSEERKETRRGGVGEKGKSR